MSSSLSLASQPSLPHAILESYDRLKVEAGWAVLQGFSAIQLTGEDRKGWLQGQVTNDLRAFDPGAAGAFCICQPTGQILAVCDAWAFPERIILTTETACVGEVLRRVDTMVIVEDVAAEPLDESHELLTIQGPMATQILATLADLPTLDAGVARIAGEEVAVLRSDRTGLGGWDVLVSAKDGRARKAIENAFGELDPVAFEIARLEAGIPRWGIDMNARTLPPEMGPWFEARHVSYNKGCYTGQEVLMRMHSRGHANRQWVCLESGEPLEAGSPVRHPARADAGTLTSVVNSPDYGYLASAMLRREVVAPGEGVWVETSSCRVEARIRPFPLQPIA
jgi:folate-binding protein YgfZ